VKDAVQPTPPLSGIEPDQACSPVKHVFFHKKHKCASTAMRGIFQRYSHRHGLVGMKPSINHFIGGYPGPFDPRFVGKRYDLYDINVNHVRYVRW